ncbi:MAG: hypothetical protein IJW53_01650 [Clostridia bacterium]|nr:hypothetical protein [Clostridia bacterium]
MKKFVILLLVIGVLSLTGCGMLQKIGIGAPDDAEVICDIVNGSKPTKITTDVSYVTNKGDTLQGHYVTTTDGTDTIFEYYYEKLATPAESLASGSNERIIVSEGTIYYKDGAYYYGDEESWKPGTGTAFELKLKVDPELIKDAVINEDVSTLEGKVSAEDLESFIGTDLGAVGDATVVLETNKVNLTMITVTCETANGTITVRTSYTYNPQDLFPEDDSAEDAAAE